MTLRDDVPECVRRQWIEAEHHEFIWRLAKECINKIQGAGSYGCTDETIIRRVANAMLVCQEVKEKLD